MPRRIRLNEKSVREAQPLKGKDYQIFDTEVRGFAICIYRSGSRAFTIDYRRAGRQRRMTIGRWPEWSTTAARERAKELRREIDAGADPLGNREQGREAPRFRNLIERYTEEHLPHLSPTNASGQKSMLRKLVEPDWGNRLVTEITSSDVERLLTKIAAGRARPSKDKPNNRARKLQGPKPTPIRANRVGEVVRKMFTLAVTWKWRADNPASGFRRRVENERERFLSRDEIGRLAEVLDAAEDQAVALTRHVGRALLYLLAKWHISIILMPERICHAIRHSSAHDLQPRHPHHHRGGSGGTCSHYRQAVSRMAAQ
jgi:Arm DNA-binding domain